MNIRPLTGQVLVEILPREKVSAGGIEIPDHTLSPEEVQATHRQPTPPPPWIGIAKAVGAWPKTKTGLLRMPEYGVGAKVVVRHNGGVEMRRNVGERYRMVAQKEILAVLH
jgi:co-chaperonin GroES (HSP10)